MLKALGIGKKKPASGDQITKHKEQYSVRAGHQHDVNELRAILERLRDIYRQKKGDFALGRYEELKNMIKESIQHYHDIASGKQHRQREHLAAVAKPKKPMSSLRMQAQSFAANQDELQKQELNYSTMTSKEIDEDLDKIRKDIVYLKEDYRQLRDRFDVIAKEYKDSKRHNPTQRYGQLKDMIKNITKDL